MKEYIATDEMFNLLNERGIEFNAEINNVLLNVSRTTKTDICREFLNKVAVTYPKSLLELWVTVDSILAEMENE